MRTPPLWGYYCPIERGSPLLASAPEAAAEASAELRWVSRVRGWDTFCLLGLPMTGLHKAGTASSMGKSCVMVESRSGEHMLHALNLSQGNWACWVLRMLSAVTQEWWRLWSAEARIPKQKDKITLPGLLARMALGSMQLTKGAGVSAPSFWDRNPEPSQHSAESPGAAGSLAQMAPPCPVLDLNPSCLGKQHWEHLGYFKQVMSFLPSLSLPPFSPKHWSLWQDGFARLKGPMV